MEEANTVRIASKKTRILGIFNFCAELYPMMVQVGATDLSWCCGGYVGNECVVSVGGRVILGMPKLSVGMAVVRGKMLTVGLGVGVGVEVKLPAAARGARSKRCASIVNPDTEGNGVCELVYHVEAYLSGLGFTYTRLTYTCFVDKRSHIWASHAYSVKSTKTQYPR